MTVSAYVGGGGEGLNRRMRSIGLLGAAFLVYSGSAWGTPPANVLLEPASAPPGTTVSVNGSGFGTFASGHINRVTFNGTPALIQRWEPSHIEVKVPFQASTGPVEIMIGRKTRRGGTFTVVRPHIEQLTPTTAERGTILRIVGRHFGPTAGSRDANTMFGVNDVVIGGVVARPAQWSDELIEVQVPSNAVSGDVVVRLASSDPLSDGSCCQPVRHLVSNVRTLTVEPTIRLDPLAGPIGTKIVLFGKEFGTVQAPGEGVFLDGQPVPIARWGEEVIVGHVPLGARSGSLVLRARGRERVVADFTVHSPSPSALSPTTGPLGTLVTIRGAHFGHYAESGSTPYSFTDFEIGEHRVEIGGVRAVVYRWQDDRIDVWVPYSAKSGKVVIYRGAGRPNPDGSCCRERGVLATEAGEFALVTPTIDSYEPRAAGLDERVTIKGRGFGTFLKGAEHAQLAINQKGYKRRDDVAINDDAASGTVLSNVSRTEVLFNGTAAIVESWSDTEIVVRVPHRNVYGIGKRGAFYDDLATGPLVVRRGSWDVLPDGTCCTDKQWITAEAGIFRIESTHLPHGGYFRDNRPDADTNQ